MLTTKIDIVPEFQNLEIARTNYADHEFPRHLHETYVIEVVIQGTVEFECRGKQFLAPAGSIILFHPGDVHTGRSANNEPVAYWSFCPTTEWMQWLQEFIDCGQRTIVFESPTLNDPTIAQQLKCAHQSLQNQTEVLHAESLMITAFSNLLRSHVSATLKENESCAVQKAKEYLNMKFSEQIRLNELAEISGLSSFYFLRSFCRTTGLTPHEYLCNVRVERARKLLANGTSISDAAFQTGFFDQSHLHRHFRRLLGITPGQYRAIFY